MKKIITITIILLSILNSIETIPTQKEVTKLYIATFNRTPDIYGLDYWVNKSNLTLPKIAQSFFDQEETQKLYPPSTSNRDFIILTYQNLFNRIPDKDGLDYWVTDLDNGVYSKNLFILTLINGAKGEDMDILDKKVESSLWYRPTVNTSWQWQIGGTTLNSSYSVDLYDIDLFSTSKEKIKELQDSGKKVICYFSAGSSEDWRDDFDKFSPQTMGNGLDGWAGERWLDIRTQEVKDIMLSRLGIAKDKGCDGVEPDNVDGYTNSSGFNLTAQNQLDYNKFIAKEAHKRGLSVALKNDPLQVKELEPYFDFSVSEECHLYDECSSYLPFINANKPVFNAEYDIKYINNLSLRVKICQEAKDFKIKTLILPLELDDKFRIDCN